MAAGTRAILIGSILLAISVSWALSRLAAPAVDCWVWTDAWCRAYPWALLAAMGVAGPCLGTLLAHRVDGGSRGVPLWLPVVPALGGLLLANRVCAWAEWICYAELPCDAATILKWVLVHVAFVVILIILAIRAYEAARSSRV